MSKLKLVGESLKEFGVDILLITDPVDIFYLTGISLSEGKLVIKEGDSRLFVDSRYMEIARKKSCCFVESLDNYVDFMEGGGIVRVGFDSKKESYFSFERLVRSLRQKKISSEIVTLTNPLKKIRALKDQDEIKAIRKACKLNHMGLDHILSILKEGISESEVSLEFEIFVKRRGAWALSFDPIIAFSENSAMPHHRSGDRRLKRGDIVLIDVGVLVDGYNSDMTRTLFFSEEGHKMADLYKEVQNAKKEALSLCRPGVKVGDLDGGVREFFKKRSLDKLFLHALGHGIGLEVHEYPRIKFDSEDSEVVLEKNMVVAIEPGLYVEGEGGIRLEDTVLVTENGYENLSM